MSNEFTITAASNSIQLSANRQGSAAYTSFNASGRPITGRAVLETVPRGEAHAAWLSVDGARERPFVIGAAEQFTVNFSAPADAASGSYTFRLKMVDVANTDEGVTDGPTVTVVVPPPPPPRSKFPIWIIPIIVGVLVVVAIVIVLLSGSNIVTMPNVVGLPEADAEATLVASDLEIGSIQREPSDVIAADLVARTEPEADAETEKSTPVSVFISDEPQATSTPTPTPRPPTATPTPSITPTPTLGVGSMKTSTVDGMAQMYVPAGPFTMGSDDGSSNEQPVRTVTLDAFWIDQTEVTNDQFAQFVTATSYETTAEEEGGGSTYNTSSSAWSYTEGADWQHPQGPVSNLNGLGDHPVVLVSWHDARAYCEWAGRRLPTEAEWEKAARGTDGRTYPWGEGISCEQANFAFDCVGDTAVVGSYADGASPYGALDMAGNVWEWVADWYDHGYYQNSPNRNPPGPASGSSKTIRGGAWGFNDHFARASSRDFNGAPTIHSNDIGFRCAQE